MKKFIRRGGIDLIIAAVKFFFLLVGAIYTISNVIKLIYKDDISSAQVFLQALGIVGFIFIQFQLYQ